MIPVIVCMFLLLTLWPNRRTAGAASLASLWNFCLLIPINVVAQQFGWWEFNVDGGTFMGVPVDLMIGWAVLWGAIPVLLMNRVKPVVYVVIMIWIDVVTMSQMKPVLVLNNNWWIGEVVSLACGLVVGIALGHMTIKKQALGVRIILQMILFSVMSMYLLPAVAFESSGSSWSSELKDLSFDSAFIWLQLILLPASVAVTAVREFYKRGGGTPYPWDPPQRLVTSGPYAYVANPMQLSMTIIMFLIGAALQSYWVVLGGFVAAAFSAGLARCHEETDLKNNFGNEWHRYRQEVRNWFPRLQPTSLRQNGRLYVASTCDPCSAVGNWYTQRNPTNLQVLPAEAHLESLRRIRYESEDGVITTGVVAVAYALEHMNLGWALTGWVMRLPVLSVLIQLFVDGLGGGPRDLPVTRNLK